MLEIASVLILEERDKLQLTTFEICAETFKLPMDMPEPAWLHNRFSTSA